MSQLLKILTPHLFLQLIQLEALPERVSGKEVEANFASLLGTRLVSPGRKASLEPPFSQGERKEEEDWKIHGRGEIMILRKNPLTIMRRAGNAAPKGRGYRRGEKAKGGISVRTYPEY